jgi:hypothetical protein
MLRALSLIFTVALVALPGVASASDPLLSGYGGPGGGEQAVLGAETLGGGSGGSGGSGSGGNGSGTGAAATPNESLRATAPAVAQQAAPTTAAPKRSTKPHRDGAKKGSGGTVSETAKGAAATPAAAAAPAVVSYPSRSTEGGGSPLSGGAVLAVLLALAAVVLIGLGLRRLSSGAPTSDDPRTPQVPAA